MSLFWIIYCISAFGLIIGVGLFFWWVTHKEGKDITLHPTLLCLFFVLCPGLNFIIFLICITMCMVEFLPDVKLLRGKK